LQAEDRNDVGFTEGVVGSEFSDRLACGTALLVTRSVSGIRHYGADFTIVLLNGEQAPSQAVVSPYLVRSDSLATSM
jgi:hypothetical protein